MARVLGKPLAIRPNANWLQAYKPIAREKWGDLNGGVSLAGGDFDNDARDIVPGAGVEGKLTKGVGAFLDVGIFLNAL